MNIYTSNYYECQFGNRISISGDKGKSVGFVGKCIPELAPKKEFWKIWHDNIGVIPEEENNRFYIKNYYDLVLSKVDVIELLKNEHNPILLCYERGEAFCHRHVLAEYINIKYGIYVKDIKFKQCAMLENPRPLYIRNILLDVMSRA